MGTRDLSDMYTRNPRAAPRVLGMHIRQITSAHVTTIKYYELLILHNAQLWQCLI